jgi:hypothetical protein
MRQALGTVGLALLVAAMTSTGYSLSIAVDDFTLVRDAEFVDIPQTSETSAEVLVVQIVGDPATVLGSILTAPSSSASDPGSGDGWTNPQTIPVVLDMSTPVAAFGLSFIHSGLLGGTLPARLDVFDQQGGAGNLIGTVTSAGYPPGPRVDFVGIWSDAVNIRSAVVPYEQHQTSVDGYGVSLTPIPEPGFLMLCAAAPLFGHVGRRHRRRA